MNSSDSDRTHVRDAQDERRRSAPVPPENPARLGGLTLALIALSATLSIYVVHVQMPANAVTLPYEASMRQPVRYLLPEGWAFFTRNPREADLTAFSRDERGLWHSAMRGPHAEFRNVFGFARGSRAQGVEIGVLVGALGGIDWKRCRGPVVACLESTPAVGVDNPAPAPTLCGDIGIASVPPVPWAWSQSQKDLTMPGTVIRLTVSC